jgi:hypothetical protein
MDPTTHYKLCPQCRQPAHLHAPQCENCGHQFRTQFAPPGQPGSQPASPPPMPPSPPPAGYIPPAQPYYPPQQGQYPPPQYPPVYPPPVQPPYPPQYGYGRTDIIQVIPGTHSVAVAVLLAVLIMGWAGMLYNRQYAKGVTCLFVSIVVGIVTLGIGSLGIWVVGIIDCVLIANRLNRGEPVGQWQFF